MTTNLTAVVAVVVFAGGPHTESRLDLALETLESTQPLTVYLTGEEFTSESLFNRVAQEFRGPVRRDQSRSTLMSAYGLARRLQSEYPNGGDLVVVTSNYHAPRLYWLLRGFLGSSYRLMWRISQDIRFSEVRNDPTARRLLLGECVSWLYCLPVGLLLRPLVVVAVCAGTVGWMHCARRRRT